MNFGTAAFFAMGAYSSVVLHKTTSLPVMIMVGGLVSGAVGLGTGYLTLRLRGTFFSIATLAMAVVVQTLVTNWDFVGGAARGLHHSAGQITDLQRRLYPIRPDADARYLRRGGCQSDLILQARTWVRLDP